MTISGSQLGSAAVAIEPVGAGQCLDEASPLRPGLRRGDEVAIWLDAVARADSLVEPVEPAPRRGLGTVGLPLRNAHPAFAGKDLTPGKTLVELVDEEEKAKNAPAKSTEETKTTAEAKDGERDGQDR